MDCRCSTGQLSQREHKDGAKAISHNMLGSLLSDEKRIYLGIVCLGTALFNLSNYSFKPQKWELEVKMIC